MKNFTSFFVVLMATLFCLQLHAQTFGVRAGLSMANMLIKDDDGTYSDDNKMNPGFHIGPTMEVPVNDRISFETGLLLSTKGFKVSEEESFMGETYDYTEKINLYYLDIPLTAIGTFDVGGAKIYGAFGPYIGIGLSGKSVYEETYDGETESEEEDIKFGSDEEEDDLKRLDYGLTAGAGVEINSILIGVSYDFGLANVAAYTGEGTTASHRVLKFSLGYKF